ncbi:MAG: hypothetical protein OEU26_29700 [Candidatus Tectomicrobia bacterium]|nr:hypothetical protein [Candidatus Tectomicrobia bacterium]
MNIPDYAQCGFPMRDDRTATHLAAWRHVCSPGAHFTAVARIDMIREARGARTCRLCDARQAALSPYAVPGEHDTATSLTAPITDLIHRMCTDPARITKSWFDQTRSTGLTPGEYVETVGVVAIAVIIDTLLSHASPMPPAFPWTAS